MRITIFATDEKPKQYGRQVLPAPSSCRDKILSNVDGAPACAETRCAMCGRSRPATRSVQLVTRKDRRAQDVLPTNALWLWWLRDAQRSPNEGHDLMNPHLNDLIAKEKMAGLRRAAERARLIQMARASDSSDHRRAVPTRIFIRLRRNVARSRMSTPSERQQATPALEPQVTHSRTSDVRPRSCADTSLP